MNDEFKIEVDTGMVDMSKRPELLCPVKCCMCHKIIGYTTCDISKGTPKRTDTPVFVTTPEYEHLMVASEKEIGNKFITCDEYCTTKLIDWKRSYDDFYRVTFKTEVADIKLYQYEEE